MKRSSQAADTVCVATLQSDFENDGAKLTLDVDEPRPHDSLPFQRASRLLYRQQPPPQAPQFFLGRSPKNQGLSISLLRLQARKESIP